MPILEPPPNPARPPEDRPQPDSPKVKLSKSRYADLEDHELIHLLDSLDDETARARFRESIYISVIICMAIAWFLLYGPRILFHQPQYKDPFIALKDREKNLTYLETPAPRVAPRAPTRSMPDKSTLQKLQQQSAQPRNTPTAPRQETQQPAPQPQQEQQPAPQEQAHNAAPPVQSPALPLPSSPRPAPAPLVDAPSANPRIAQNSPSAHDSMQELLRGARTGPSGPYGAAPSPGGPVQAGAQILSDTQGVDFSAYLRRVVSDTRRNWEPLIPEEVRPPLMKKGIVGIRFSILPGGQIGGMTLETRSGDVALDKAAWFAITSEGNFPPLPREFHGPQLELRFGFFYNTPVQQ
jgi:outer membrane biosynthesis protein TonB